MLSRIGSLLLLLFVPFSYGLTLKEINQQLSTDFATKMRKNNVPGAAYVVVKNDAIVALETFGHVDKAKTQAVDPNTVFRLASVSKTFAATLATMLAQEKQLNLSDPVTKFVPEFKLAKKGAAEQIQLKHLLSHSTGLVPNAYDNLLHENWSMEKIIRRFDRVKPLCEPEQCYGYQNVAFAFVQPAIEASQSKSYAKLLNERLFVPLEMKDASVGIDVFDKGANTAKPHLLRKRVNTGRKDKKGKPIKRNIWRTVKVTPDFYKVEPAAGVNASITDLAKWLIANLGNNKEVLSPELLQELTEKRIKTRKDLRRKHWRAHLTDAHYGYGWRIYQFKDHPIYYHSGWVAGFVAEVGYSPHLDIGFAVLINAESNFTSQLSSEFWAKAHELGGPGKNQKLK